MKKLVFILLFFVSATASAQVFQKNYTWLDFMNRVRVQGMFRPPLASISNADTGSFYYNKADSSFRYWTGSAYRVWAGGSTYTASGGITLSGNDFRLGGTLIGNTNINSAGYNFQFTNPGRVIVEDGDGLRLAQLATGSTVDIYQDAGQALNIDAGWWTSKLSLGEDFYLRNVPSINLNRSSGNTGSLLFSRQTGTDNYFLPDSSGTVALRDFVIEDMRRTPGSTTVQKKINGTWSTAYIDSAGGLPKTTKSVTVASDSIQLVNDSTTLTGSKVYGTDSTGVRGWQPALKTVLTSPTAGEILIFRDANTLVNAANAGASIGVLQFKVGDTDAPANGDSLFTHTGFIDKYLAVYREGLRQYYNVSANGVEVNTASGTVTFHPVLTTGEEIVIERRNFESVEQMELETSTFSHTITDYSGAGAAYSLMKLSSGYSGYAVTVRRSSDNTTQDIGFVNNYLDTAAMKSFVGANNGFISKWYDQSGNARDLAQTTNSLQPQIIASGAVYYKSGRPSVYFGGTQYLFKTGFTVNQPDTWFVVGEIGTTANRGFFDGGSARQILGINGTTVNFAGSFGNYGSSVNTFSLFYTLFDGASSKIAVNGNAGVTVSSGANALTDLYMGYWSGGGGMTGYISELILYPSNQSANKAGIETSINSRYSIY